MMDSCEVDKPQPPHHSPHRPSQGIDRGWASEVGVVQSQFIPFAIELEFNVKVHRERERERAMIMMMSSRISRTSLSFHGITHLKYVYNVVQSTLFIINPH